MRAVGDVGQLNFWLRRFAPRIVLRLAPEVVEASSSEGRVHARTTITVASGGGNRRILGIGDDAVADPAALSLPVFAPSPDAPANPDDLVVAFLRAVLQRLPRRGSFIRPVVVVEGLQSLHQRLGGREREVIIGALEKAQGTITPQRNRWIASGSLRRTP